MKVERKLGVLLEPNKELWDPVLVILRFERATQFHYLEDRINCDDDF